MELQGKKTTHDFLSLYKDSAFPRRDPTPPQQGFFLKTQDFLQPLEGKKRKSTTTCSEEGSGGVTPTSGGSTADHVLPFGGPTKSSSLVVVKPEWGTVAPVTAVTSGNNGNLASHLGGAFSLWEDPISRENFGSAAGGGGGGTGLQNQQSQWLSSTYTARVSNSVRSLASLSSTRSQRGKDRRASMDAASKCGKGLTDEDDDEEEFGKREGSSQKELTVKVDRKGNNDQKATTPRSKHSATEQRRRSKINDRFQILRDLIPHSDQKRDKASFLLEVIEYIQFLHEKVHKYESGYPAWSHENSKLTPWKNSQVPVEAISDPSQALHNGPSSSGFVLSGDSALPVTPVVVASNHTTLESENVSTCLAHKAGPIPAVTPLQQYGFGKGFLQPNQRLISDSEHVATPSQSQCLRHCSGSGGDVLGEQELTIDEGTISISSAYSQGLLNALTEALQSSGIDLSQASISVQINLGKRAFARSLSNPKEHEERSQNPAVGVGHSQMGSTVDESEQGNKRHKPDKS